MNNAFCSVSYRLFDKLLPFDSLRKDLLDEDYIPHFFKKNNNCVVWNEDSTMNT